MSPLTGISVVDMTETFGGSFCTMHLADFGADVIKVEFTGHSNNIRSQPPLVQNKSGVFAAYNRGKKSIVLDPEAPDGQTILAQLIEKADAVVVDLNDDIIRKYSLQFEQLGKFNPALIYASLSGFGGSGSLSSCRCHDVTAQAISGTMAMTGFPDKDPVKVGSSVADSMGGSKLCLGILMAVFTRMKTGKGQKVEIATADSLFEINESPVLFQTVLNQVTTRAGNGDATITPYEIYETRDGHISIGVASDAIWPGFCRSMKMEHIIDDPRFTSNEKRLENYSVLNKLITDYVKTLGKQELQTMLDENSVPSAPVLSVAEVMSHPQLLHREMVVELKDPLLGRISVPGIAIKLEKSPGSIKKSGPDPGENTNEILQSLGYSQEKIEALRINNII